MHELIPGACYLLPTGERVMTAVFLLPCRDEPAPPFAVTPAGRILLLDEPFWATVGDNDGTEVYERADTGFTMDDLLPDAAD
jgi:hypothetical protein